MKKKILLGILILGGSMLTSCNLAGLFPTNKGSTNSTTTTTGGTQGNGTVELTTTTPFYIDAKGDQIALNGAILDTTTQAGTFNLLVTQAQYQECSTDAIGFQTISFPKGTTISKADLSKIEQGAVTPYTVTVIGSDATTAAYEFTLSVQNPVDKNIAAITAQTKNQTLTTTETTLDNTEAIQTLKNTIIPLAVNDNGTDYYVMRGNTYTPNLVAADSVTGTGAYYTQGEAVYYQQTQLQAFAPMATPTTAWSAMTGTWLPGVETMSPAGAPYSRTQTVTQTNWRDSSTDVATYLRGGTAYQEPTSYVAGLVTDQPITIGLTYANAGQILANLTRSTIGAKELMVENAKVAFSGAAGSVASNAVTESATITLNWQDVISDVLNQANFDTTTSGSYVVTPQGQTGNLISGEKGSYLITAGETTTGSATATASLSFPENSTTTTTPQGDYYLFYDIVVTKTDAAATFTGVTFSPSLVSGTIVNGNTLTFTMVDPGQPGVDQKTGVFAFVPKQSGIIGQFTITSNSSTQQYQITLE